ncbi:MAG: ABC transporter permease [Patescibacteria group bacterium]|nr:ABC transporter permease [Patescibacteria group bacterium]
MFNQIVLSLRITLQNFLSAKMRTFLTVLGIVVGIAAVIVVMSVGTSAQNMILDQIRVAGSDLVGVMPGAAEEDGPPVSMMGIVVTTLKNEDMEAMRKKTNVPHALAVSGYVSGNEIVQYGSYSKSYTFQGVSADMIDVESSAIAQGRFFNEVDDESLAQVVVLGARIAKNIFDNEEVLGKKIKIGSQSFRVIGVMEERGTTLISNYDDMIYIPLKTAQKNILNIDYLNFIRMKVDDENNVLQTQNDVELLLRSRHNIADDEEGDFTVRNIAAALSIIGNITNIMKYFLTAVASIALIVGGIGVMNIMFIALSKRVREIGLRKAVGARKRDIVWQFLFEAMIISFIGGLIGFVVGLLVIWITAVAAQQYGLSWDIVITMQMVYISLGISIVIGFLFGVYPAWKAAKISPMEALGYE